MDSSYLYMSKRKRFNVISRKMDRRSSSGSNITVDSLEEDFKRKNNNRISDDFVDTILVPFYEKDVLIKVPKVNKKKSRTTKNNNNNKNKNKSDNATRDPHPSNNYLVNKDSKAKKSSSYLEIFRKQFTGKCDDKKKKTEHEVRSTSPQYGDTERDSFLDEDHAPMADFYNTECFNELYYERLLAEDVPQLMSEQPVLDELQLTDDLCNVPDEYSVHHLKSVSDVSHNRHSRKAINEPATLNVRLGGLGPDIENIKPRLDRARSLQRYSEKVRMENRLRIYKKSVQTETNKVKEPSSARRRETPRREEHVHTREREDHIHTREREREDHHKSSKEAEHNNSYLVNKSGESRKSVRKLLLSKSADVKKQKHKTKVKESSENKDDDRRQIQKKSSEHGKMRLAVTSKSRGNNTDEVKTMEVPPVQINFMLNLGRLRPSTALKHLEEKHRMYQDRVKAFIKDHGNH